ncbi:hypothetical protein JCM10450v2_007823 [Rhodotorula kratochvilovae]
MCGRFALGIAADDLAYNVQHEYFAPPPHRSPLPDQHNADDQHGDEGGDDEAWDAAHAEPQQQGGAHEQGSPRVEWASREAKSQFRPRFNVAPTTRVPVLRRSTKDPNTLEFDLLRWGLIPHWYASPPDSGLSTINAQCESVFEGTPAWRGPRESKRCVVVAQGFYEWLTKGKDKVPHFVKRKDGRMMVFAGLWDHCDYKGAYDPVTSYTILTVPVNKQLRFLHTRMPAILSSASEIALWLSPRKWGPELKALVRPYEGECECYAVDKGVGKAGNESEEFIKPVAQKKGSLDSLFAKQFSAAASSPSSSSPAKPSPSASSSKPQPSSSTSLSKPKLAASSPAEKKLKKQDDDDDDPEPTAFNTDEASPSRLATVAEELGASSSPGKGKGKKRAREEEKGQEEEVEIEVLDLSADSGEEVEVKPRGGAKKKAKTFAVSPKKKKGAQAEGTGKKKGRTKADEEGNEALTDFFPVKGE